MVEAIYYNGQYVHARAHVWKLEFINAAISVFGSLHFRQRISTF